MSRTSAATAAAMYLFCVVMSSSVWQGTNPSRKFNSILQQEQMPLVLARIDDKFLLSRENLLHGFQVEARFRGLRCSAKGLFGGLKASGVAFGAGLAANAVCVGVLQCRCRVAMCERQLLVLVAFGFVDQPASFFKGVGHLAERVYYFERGMHVFELHLKNRHSGAVSGKPLLQFFLSA